MKKLIINAILLIYLSLGLCFILVMPILPAIGFTLEDIVIGMNFSRQTIENGEMHIEVIRSPLPPSKEVLQSQLAGLRTQVKQWEKSVRSTSLSTEERDYLKKFLKIYYDTMEILPFGRPIHDELFITFEILNSSGENNLRQQPLQYRYRVYQMDLSIDAVSEGVAVYYHLGYCRTYIFDGISQLRYWEGPYLQPELEVFDFENEMPFSDFHLLGRVPFKLPTSLELKDYDDSVRLIVEKGQEQKESVYIVEYKFNDGIIYKLWCDPNKAFCLDKFIVYHESAPDHLMEERLYDGYTQSANGIWYPRISHEVIHGSGGSRSSKQILINDARFNVNLPENIFRIEKE